MTNRINIKIKYNGTDLADLQPPVDTAILTIYGGMLKAKFDAAASILDKYNVQSLGIMPTEKALDGTIEVTDFNHLNMDLAPFDLSAEIA